MSVSVVSYICLFLYCLISILPLLAVGVGALSPAENGVAFLNERQWLLFVKSLAIAINTSLISVLIGTLAALALRCTLPRMRKLYLCLLLIPLFIPPFVMGIAIPAFGSKFSISIAGPFWVIALQVACFFPLAMLLVLSSLNSINRQVLDAGRVRWHWGGIIRRIILPLAGKNILIAGLIVFILALGEYGLPSLLQVQTYPIEIMTEFSAFYNEGSAVRLCIPLLVSASIALLFMKWFLRDRYRAVVPSRNITEWDVSPVFRVISYVFLVAIIALTVVVPIFALISGVSGLQSFVKAWNTANQQVLFSVVFCFVALAISSVLAWFLAGLEFKSRPLLRRVVGLITLLPLAIPGSIMGVGFIMIWNKPYLDWLSGNWLIMPLIFVALFLPLMQKSLLAEMRSVHESIWSALKLSPRSSFTRFIKVELPLLKKGMVVGAVAMFVLGFRELSATVLVIPPGYETLSLRCYTLSHYGANDMVMALCLMTVFVMLMGYMGVLYVFKN